MAYGERVVRLPVGSYRVLSAAQVGTAVAVSYAFQVVSLRGPEDLGTDHTQVGQFAASYIMAAKGRKASLLVVSRQI